MHLSTILYIFNIHLRTHVTACSVFFFPCYAVFHWEAFPQVLPRSNVRLRKQNTPIGTDGASFVQLMVPVAYSTIFELHCYRCHLHSS